MKTLIAFLCLLVFASSAGQVFPVQVSTQITPPYSPYLSDYTAPGAQNFVVNIYAKDLSLSQYPFKIRLTIEGPGITLRTKPHFTSSPFHLQGGAPLTLYGEDLHGYLHPRNLDFSGLPYTEYSRTARLPDGIYRFTIEILDYNRGTVVSNKGTTSVWIILNDPPILLLPSNFSTLRLQEPTNMLFKWTPRHTGSPNSAFTTEYTFSLVELWQGNQNPNDAFLSQRPLFEATTSETQFVYTAAEPQLLPGRKYAWRVQARESQGKDLFKNGGRSEVFVFQYGEALPIPPNLRMRWAKPSTLAMQWDPVKHTDGDIRYRLQYRPRRRSENHEWYETWTRFTDKTLYHLQTNTDYEMRIRSENSLQESEYSDIQVFTTLREEPKTFVCSDEIVPPTLPDNTLPVFPLSINDTLHAGGYDILVRDVQKVGSKYYGSGLAIVPWMNSARVRVSFENIGVNDRFWLTSGTIKSWWTKEGSFLFEEQAPIVPGKAPQAGELDITIVATDSLITYSQSAIASVTVNDDGDPVVITTDGKEQVLQKGESYALTDGVGNGYVIDEAGNVAKTTASEAIATATRGGREYSIALQFLRGDAEFGFDEKRFEGLASYYGRVSDGSYIPWKALSSSKPDVIAAKVSGDALDLSRVRFETGNSPVTNVGQDGNGELAIRLQGRVAGLEEELIASYGVSDTIPPKIVGKLNLVTYNSVRYDLEIIPVNDATLPDGLDVSSIAKEINDVYRQAVVEWNVTLRPSLRVPLPDTFDEGETGLFSNYTDDMKTVLRAHGSFRDNTYYIFLVDEPRNPSTLGYMPRNRQAGFVFVGPHQGNAAEFLKTIAHELGHGAFNLKHTFSEHSLPAGTTDNLMDYSTGTALYKYQWDHIHEPQTVIGLFESGEEGEMNFTLAKIEDEFLRKMGSAYASSGCWNKGVARAYEVSDRFEMDVAMYAGFLRFMLCETEKDNCGKSNDISPYACGMINAFLEELDWISMLEAAEGVSIDPEEILTCMVTSFPIGGKPDDDLTMESVMFKCLVGIDLDDLTDAIKEFVVANWDEPYYQGQATAYALTLLSPLKGKILNKLEKIPHYASKLDNFKILSKAASKDELVGLAQLTAKVPDDDELQMLHRSIKYLPGPELPPRIAASFTNSIYKNRKLITSERFFKYHGVNNRTGRKYTWLVKKKYSNESHLREALAIRRDWGVHIDRVTEFEAPPGTWVSEGTAAPQGLGYPGGDYQAVILNVPKVWIIKTTQAF